MSTKPTKLKRFLVSYRITEIQCYEIDAIDAARAEADAYFDGTPVTNGSLDVQSFHCEEVRP